MQSAKQAVSKYLVVGQIRGYEMGDRDSLHDKKNDGYSDADIIDAQTSGATPAEGACITKQERQEKLKKLKNLRDTKAISKEEFKKRKVELFK